MFSDFADLSMRITRDYTASEVHVPYVTMRMLPGILGIAVVPLAYLTLRTLGTRKTTATMGASLIIFENGLVTQSRLILLDSPLVFFTALTAFFWTRFSRADHIGVPFIRCCCLMQVGRTFHHRYHRPLRHSATLDAVGQPKSFPANLGKAFCSSSIVPDSHSYSLLHVHVPDTLLDFEQKRRWGWFHEFGVPTHPHRSRHGGHICRSGLAI
jgi:hypothetical protein